MPPANRRRPEQRRRSDAPAVAVERPAFLVSGLAGLGILLAAYLTWLKFRGGGALLCTAGSGCDLVQASRYSTFLWVPTALWGLAVYVAIGVLAWLGLGARNWLIAFVLASGGVGFSLYLTWLSVFTIGATCVWCLASAGVFVVILAVLVMRRPPESGRRSLSQARMVTYGALAAVGAIVGGAFVFAAPFSAPPGYQMALARHLADSKAVMYGAFW
jgi:uncharacterized membrane protein